MKLLRFLMQAALTAAAATVLAPAHAAHGPVMAIGGALADDNDAVWARLVALAGGAGARFAVFATPSGEPDAAAARIVANLQRRGAVAEHIRVAPRIAGIDLAAEVRNPHWIARVDAAQGVYFSGGAQARLVDTLRPGGVASPLLHAVQALHRRGGVVAGSSAGAAVLSDWMFRDPPGVLAVLQGALHEGRDIDRGLGFLAPQLLVDQHLVKRGRFARMLALMAARGPSLGLGVEEDSAALIEGGRMEVLGARGVLVADAGEAPLPAAAGSAGPLRWQGLRLHWLQPGDRFDLDTRTPAPAPARAGGTRIDPHAPGFRGEFGAHAFYPDMLGENVIVNAMTRLVDSPAQEAVGLAFDAGAGAAEPGVCGRGTATAASPAGDAGFEFRLYKEARTQSWRAAGEAQESIFSVRLDVQPVRVARPLYRPWDGVAPARGEAASAGPPQGR